jgi:hypothetical protein
MKEIIMILATTTVEDVDRGVRVADPEIAAHGAGRKPRCRDERPAMTSRTALTIVRVRR